MTERFAGSRSLDERRRRRLATESDDTATEAVAAPLPRRASAAKAPLKNRGPSYFPLRKLISARWWKHAGIVCLGLLLGAAILAGGWAAEHQARKMGPGFVRFFDLKQARLVRVYVSTAIFLASQLAFLIWWLRSQSMRDFSGRYRGWACCAFLGFVAAFAIQTDALHAWSQTVAWFWRTDFWNKPTLSWLVPVVLCGLPVWQFLHQEMRDCRVSLALLCLVVLLGAGFAALEIYGPLPLAPPAARLVQCGIAMLAAQCLFLSLLFQARHAIYISVEPPADRTLWLLNLWRRWRQGSTTQTVKIASPTRVPTPVAAEPRRRKRAEQRPQRRSA